MDDKFLVVAATLIVVGVMFVVLYCTATMGSKFTVGVLSFIRGSVLCILPGVLVVYYICTIATLLFGGPLPTIPTLILCVVCSGVLA